MLHYALVFFVLAVIAAIFGFGGFIAGTFALLAKVCLALFVVAFLVSLIFNRPVGTPPPY